MRVFGNSGGCLGRHRRVQTRIGPLRRCNHNPRVGGSNPSAAMREAPMGYDLLGLSLVRRHSCTVTKFVAVLRYETTFRRAIVRSHGSPLRVTGGAGHLRGSPATRPECLSGLPPGRQSPLRQPPASWPAVAPRPSNVPKTQVWCPQNALAGVGPMVHYCARHLLGRTGAARWASLMLSPIHHPRTYARTAAIGSAPESAPRSMAAFWSSCSSFSLSPACFIGCGREPRRSTHAQSAEHKTL